MTKVLVVSDNHGSISELELLRDRYDNMKMLNCGDLELDPNEIALFNMTYVKGNSFYDRDLPDEQYLEIEGVKILMCHGHMQGVKYGKYDILNYARKKKVDLVLHGHTHVPDLRYEDNDVFLICPGSVLRGYGKYRKTYCLLSIDGTRIKAELKELESGETFECLTNY